MIAAVGAVASKVKVAPLVGVDVTVLPATSLPALKLIVATPLPEAVVMA